MTATLYPVAATAEGALHAPEGFAEREGEARLVAAGAVAFVVEPVGPAFVDPEAARATYAAGGRAGAALADGWGRLTPMAEATALRDRPPLKPTYAGGRRWPRADTAAAPTRWRLWVSYWRIGPASERPAGSMGPDDAARRLRRRTEGQTLPAATLSALARQPLRPVRPQQPLDIGLFEARRPEEPDLIIPDE